MCLIPCAEMDSSTLRVRLNALLVFGANITQMRAEDGVFLTQKKRKNAGGRGTNILERGTKNGREGVQGLDFIV